MALILNDPSVYSLHTLAGYRGGGESPEPLELIQCSPLGSGKKVQASELFILVLNDYKNKITYKAGMGGAGVAVLAYTVGYLASGRTPITRGTE